MKNIEKMNPKRKPKTTKIANVAGSIWLSLFMDGIVESASYCPRPNNRPKQNQHLNIVIERFYFKTSAYGPKWKKACALNEETMGGTK